MGLRMGLEKGMRHLCTHTGWLYATVHVLLGCSFLFNTCFTQTIVSSSFGPQPLESPNPGFVSLELGLMSSTYDAAELWTNILCPQD
jgi:hypothetical protein